MANTIRSPNGIHTVDLGERLQAFIPLIWGMPKGVHTVDFLIW
ncbi:MAG: hypothetical protein OXI67_09500 [Candidatus Poribacteria bacterium]|nr:hypothetical protein [Candidatus Poribacteria bacterium]